MAERFRARLPAAAPAAPVIAGIAALLALPAALLLASTPAFVPARAPLLRAAAPGIARPIVARVACAILIVARAAARALVVITAVGVGLPARHQPILGVDDPAPGVDAQALAEASAAVHLAGVEVDRFAGELAP